jgi:ElaA protein
VKQRDPMRLEWLGFADFSPALLYEVLRLRQAIFVVEQCCAYPDLDGLDQRGRHLLLWSGDVLAGYLRLIPFAAEARVTIGRVAVAPEFRRCGFARRLMQEALIACERDHPAQAVTLSAQTDLARFYESLGFEAVPLPYDDYGVPHIGMVRRG